MEVETGIEPVCTALQAVASPLGHSTAGVDATAPRADDGIRTRDPHLGKVMRYQLRYIRAPRTTCRPSRRTTIVQCSVAAQIPTATRLSRLRTGDRPGAAAELASGHDRVFRAPLADFSTAGRSVITFDVVPRSRSSGGERPPHTRKVTGSIPVGTTSIVAVQQ